MGARRRMTDPVLGRLPGGGDMGWYYKGEDVNWKVRTKMMPSRRDSLSKGQVVGHSMVLMRLKVVGT